MRVAIIQDGIVINVVIADDPERVGGIACPDDVGIGWSYSDGTFTAPPAPDPEPAPVPASITRRQLLLALNRMGLITGEEALAAAKTGAVPAAVRAVFDNMQPADKLAAEITWASMSVAERSNPLVAALAQANGMTDAEIDDFFRLAASI